MFRRLKEWCGLIDNQDPMAETLEFLERVIREAEARGDYEEAAKLKEQRRAIAMARFA